MPDLPNLFVVGAAKAGTTALYQYFRAHPQICVPKEIKEPNYMAFSDDSPSLNGPGDRLHGAAKSITNLPDYLQLYSDRKAQLVAADISPAYLCRPKAADKIAKLCPEAKIVIVLRNPVEAAFSMFSMLHRDRRETCISFAEAFHRSPERAAAGWEWAWDYQGVFLYSQQVTRYLKLFPPAQLFIRRYEELKFTPEKFYRELTGFIGVDNLELPHANQWVNVAARRRDMLRRTTRGKIALEFVRAARKILPRRLCDRLGLNRLDQPAFRMSTEQRRMLVAHFRDDVRQLSTILSWNLDDWLRVDEPAPMPEQPAPLPARTPSGRRLVSKEVQKTA